jgi:flagellar protein FliO/FliZ
MALAIALTTHVHSALAVESASDKTPLHLPAPSGSKSSIAGSSGGGLLRTIIGLLIVVVVIWGISKVLRYVKANKETKAIGNGLQSVATLPLGHNRAVHVVRVGSEILLLGTAEQQVTQLARYTEDEARERGLLETPAARKSMRAPAALRNAAASMRQTSPVDVSEHDVAPVAVTRNGSPVGGAGTGSVVGTMLDQLRARTVRK